MSRANLRKANGRVPAKVPDEAIPDSDELAAAAADAIAAYVPRKGKIVSGCAKTVPIGGQDDPVRHDQGQCHSGKVPGQQQQRRLGDLNPGWA